MGVRALVSVGVLPALGLMAALPATAAAANPSASVTHHVLQLPRAVGARTTVIVMLKDEEARLGADSPLRSRLLVGEERPLATSLTAAGARVKAEGKAIPYLVASVSAAQEKALAADPLVRAVAPNSLVSAAPEGLPAGRENVPAGSANLRTHSRPAVSAICGTANHPEVDPEAITASAINSVGANALGYDGAGIKVAYIAGSIDTTIADYQRNPRWASTSSPAGSPVVTNVNFSGDPSSAPGGDVAGESFLDASSIAAQGNTVYNLDNYISSTHSLPAPCDITITGAAPGASVLGLDVFSNDYDTTESNFLEAIDYAVKAGVKVLNESFGANNFPDTALDLTRIADNDAVAAGVTVVVSSGDAGVGNTLGEPSTDPNLISAGASTTFRSYEQDFYGGINATIPKANNGTWIDNNISSLSSSGFAMTGGNTVDLVAPGDLNWTECSTSSQFAAGCTNDNGDPSPISLSGGTSESAPLTSGAAADVIQAYASTHGGSDPSPALVKRILMSTARDVNAPAEEQGAGLLDVLAAVKEATSIAGTSGTRNGGLLISPNQINIVQNPKASSSSTIGVTNTGSSAVTVHLSTRALTKHVATTTSSFCLNPSSSAKEKCGPPTTNSFQIWSGVTEVYQEKSFTVPTTKFPSRLDFVADYPSDNPAQTSLLHVALFSPSGAYAGYSLPQGQADYARVEVADPAPGAWTAVFFTEKDDPSTKAIGTSGTIQYRATTWEFAPAGKITPSALTIGPGKTATARFTATSPTTSGDTSQSIVLWRKGAPGNTIPVTVRTLVPTTAEGGNFTGVLTGGNGRAAPANTSIFAFSVPRGLHDLHVSASFSDVGDVLGGYLIDPSGEAVSQSSNLTEDNAGAPLLTGTVDLYADHPAGGRWEVVFDWLQPVSGNKLALPFNGAVHFNDVNVSANVPGALTPGSHTVDVRVKNTGLSPEAFFIDPRTSTTAPVRLTDLLGSDQNLHLPLPPGLSFPLYFVPNDTTGVVANVSSTVPVTFDVEPFPGDPDLSPAVGAPGEARSQGHDSASLTYISPEGGVISGLWYLNPSEIGPYGSSGAPTARANASFWAITRTFDSHVTSPTGDLWTMSPFALSGFHPVYVAPGASATIPVTIAVPTSPGRVVTGSINVDDTYLINDAVGLANSGGDELASIPYGFKVK